MLVIFFVFFAFLIRVAPHVDLLSFIPHLPNFSPIAAIALFSAVYLKREYALVLPILIMIATDLIIGFYTPWIMVAVYGSFLIIGLIGIWLRDNKNYSTIAMATVTGSILFYLITNFAVWAIPNSFYPHTFSGLLTCYTMGLPFFKNTLMGDVFYVSGMFGLYELINYIYFRRVTCQAKLRN